MIHFESICLLLKSIPQEAESIVADHRPDHDWPQRGHIVFNNVSLRSATCPPFLSPFPFDTQGPIALTLFHSVRGYSACKRLAVSTH